MARLVPKEKIIGGKPYRLDKVFRSKNMAIQVAKERRRKGKSARVYSVKGAGHCVYIRKMPLP